MGRVVPFYVPDGFKPSAKVKSAEQRDAVKVIEFPRAETKKPA